MRKQQKDIKTKRFLSKKDLDSSSLASRTRQRNDARDKDKKHAQEHEKREAQDASKRLRENTSRSKNK